MRMAVIQKYLVWLVIACVVTAAIAFFFFFQFGHNDAKVLADFPIAYAIFDRAIADYSKSALGSSPEGGSANIDLELKADEALADLNTKASARISSLTRNDGDLMQTMLEIADLSGKELVALKEYKTAVADGSSDLNKAAAVYADLTQKRQTAYLHFRELAGIR